MSNTNYQQQSKLENYPYFSESQGFPADSLDQNIKNMFAQSQYNTKKRYDESRKKIENCKDIMLINFENLSDSDEDENSYLTEQATEKIPQKNILSNLEQQYFQSSQIHNSLNEIEQAYEKFTKKYNIPKESIDLLEAKKILLQKTRKSLFSQVKQNKISNGKKTEDSRKKKIHKINSLSEIFHIGKKQSQSQNQKKIEKQLVKIYQKFYNYNNQEDYFEHQLMKKYKIDSLKYTSKIQQVVGLKHSDFRKMKCYRTIPGKIPFFSNDFAEAEKQQIPQLHPILNEDKIIRAFNEIQNSNNIISESKLPSEKYQKPQNKSFKIQDDFNTTPIEPTSSPLKIKFNQAEMYKSYDDIQFSQQQIQAQKDAFKQKMSKMTEEEIDKYKQHLVKKQWKCVVKDVFKIYRFQQRSRQDVEQNCKKFAILCAKEVKKRYMKSQKIQKEHQFRAKKQHKEMIIYWKRREKELAELKKRQEKLEAELRKREEEEQEAIKKKKSLEYLMKQAGMFSFIMAKKVGVNMQKPNSTQEEVGGIPQGERVKNKKQIMYKGKQIEIEVDEDKAAEDIAKMIENNQQKVRDFDEKLGNGIQQAGAENITVDELKRAEELDFTQVDEQSYEKIIQQPPTFKGNLKNYQLKGLRWLDNLYTQGINGILADEMGLGKTIQAISLIAHLCSDKKIWGPFLIIAPASTLYNWQQEIKKFFPQLKVLPYWGSSKQRKTIRKFFSAKNLGHENSVFHAVITSYQLIVSDEKSFHRLPWQYMILDEAQNIKNINSIRWQILLTIKARNKLLLTGTPIQNSMAELWALLHFIMPTLFNSHDQFQEWFSKDIEEAAVQDKNVLNQQQLQRLHMILKPFMLRRIKKDVEHEIGKKIEIEVLCELTRRQQRFYDTIKEKLSLQDFFTLIENNQKMENLMNLVMQFRKVCNHPELFERRPNRSTYVFSLPYYSTTVPMKFGDIKQVTTNIKNPIIYNVPKIIYDSLIQTNNQKTNFILKNISITSPEYIKQQFLSGKPSSLYSFLRFFNLSFQFLDFVWNTDTLYLQVVLNHYFHTIHSQKYSNNIQKLFPEEEEKNQLSPFKENHHFIINEELFNFANINNSSIFDNTRGRCILKEFYQENQIFDYPKAKQNLGNMIGYNPKRYYIFIPHAVAPMLQITSTSAEFHRQHIYDKQSQRHMRIFFGPNYSKSASNFNITKSKPKGEISVYPNSQEIIPQNGYMNSEFQESRQNLEIVDFNSLVADSTKLKYLDGLLARLKRDGHKVLIFSQMTKMLNILEDFMNKRQYLFFRLDGSTNISDRKDMVTEFQTNPKVFCFLLSTRAGGLGITLTAADVVIFYDNDWNPTMDQQATDRAHRIGQTKDVYVYKMITKGTIEERIVKRAKQKQQIQSTVYGGGSFKEDIMKPQEVMELLFDESEFTNQQHKFQATKQAITKKKQKKNNIKKKETTGKAKKSKKKQNGNNTGKSTDPNEEEQNKDLEQQQQQQEENKIENEDEEEEIGIDLHKMDEDEQEDDPEDVIDD